MNGTIVLKDDFHYGQEQEPRYGWMRWDDVPIDWGKVFGNSERTVNELGKEIIGADEDTMD